MVKVGHHARVIDKASCWVRLGAQALLRVAVRLGVMVVLVMMASGNAMAQGIESVLAPGKVILGHAKAEAQCDSCHRRFDREAQDTLCGECHKDVRADLRDKRGFHGRQKPQACRACHTDHKGRDANIVQLDVQRFDHRQSDYPLTGKHTSVPCKACHGAGKRWREAPSECHACHQKDDVHKAALGTKCQDCHGDADWKRATFDHDKTRFALKNKHDNLKCSSCHKDQRYQDAPRACIGCHRKDDEHVVQGRRGHQGQYGEKCESCHHDKGWKPSTFVHDRDTQYALKGKHRSTECKACHAGPLYRQKLATDCHSCHKKDDKHEGSLGTKCADCHQERSWKEPSRFDHDKTSFPLLGKHVDAKCEACHKSTVFRDAPKACVACHLKDDKHEATLGKACERCHGERTWKETKGRFDHDKTRFALRQGHAKPTVVCTSCHRDLKHFRDTPMACLSCHKKDDKHHGQLGARCEQCHSDRDWKTTQAFDHDKSRFPLTGRHIVTACKDCHTSLRYKDAPRDCDGCHKTDDVHQRKLGTQCQSCHSTRAWALWTFDHDKATAFRLDDGHRRVACVACHTLAVAPGRAIAAVGRQCIGCHRKDDAHDGDLGQRCEQCHTATRWKNVTQRGMRQSRLAPGEVQGWGLGLASHAARVSGKHSATTPWERAWQ